MLCAPIPFKSEVFSSVYHFRLANMTCIEGFEERRLREIETLIVGNFIKFAHYPELREILLSTEDAEIIACGDDEKHYNGDSCGQEIYDFNPNQEISSEKNKLGKALMIIRSFFMKKSDNGVRSVIMRGLAYS
ncbi:hypothetical protein PRIPAC_91592 [Pristionchus pacificus]|uniref:Uncharacterized protein n=1 Tax=Pristionchus pacificus TaxID=54126 RepID=A0A2A6BQR6_PRIPA|nr:hypothetical protein PRIPAC_91592 [Pristionchus pacificus]|eukprot:PDM68235.1 hypothetical protein PRIPAC_46279 [Pristionchus pacificus]